MRERWALIVVVAGVLVVWSGIVVQAGRLTWSLFQRAQVAEASAVADE
jgi:hypothetical protein